MRKRIRVKLKNIKKENYQVDNSFSQFFIPDAESMRQGIKEISKEYAQILALKDLGFSCHEAAEFIFALKSFQQDDLATEYKKENI